MKKKFNKFIQSKSLLVILIILLIALVIATGTYAWLTWQSTSNTSMTMTIGKMADVTFTSGNDISTNNLAPVFNYIDGEKTTFSINNRDTSGASFDYSIILNITSIADELKNKNLKYVILKENTIVKEDDFSNITTGDNNIYSDKISTNGTTNFTLYLYIDGNNDNDLTMMNKSLVGTIVVTEGGNTNIANTITSLYKNATKTTITNNSINYQYDTTNQLMQDPLNNIRYYGANPKNYIYFNCNDYSNQSSTTCEIWRIIGVFNGKLKIMRNSDIGAYSWNNNSNSEWSESVLMKELNPNFTGSNGSLYWNRASGACTISSSGTCNFTSTGLKNDATRNAISNSTWNIGATVENYVDVDLSNEIKTTYQSYVGLPNTSDYGYATDLNLCKSMLMQYSETSCVSNNWMAYMANGNTKVAVLINRNSNGNMNVIVENGNVDIFDNDINDALPTNAYDIFPTLHLQSTTNLASGTGTGTISDPYQLAIN